MILYYDLYLIIFLGNFKITIMLKHNKSKKNNESSSNFYTVKLSVLEIY